MPKETKFHGILAVGRTKADAINNYRLLAMSKGAAVQVDGGREIAFVTHANSAEGMFNPMSGNMDLSTDDALLSKLEFKSNSSADDVEVHHLVCTSGCMSHVVFDSADLVKYCPNCTSSLSEDDSEEDDSEEADDSADLEDELGADDDSDESESADDEEGDAEEGDADESEEGNAEEGDADESEEGDAGSDEEDDSEEGDAEEGDADESEEGDAGSDEEDDSEEGDKPKGGAEDAPADEALPEYTEDDGSIVIAADSLAQATQLFRDNMPTTSVSSGKASVDAHYMMCSSSDCGAHVVSTDEIAECPACHAPAVEPTTEEAAPVAAVSSAVKVKKALASKCESDEGEEPDAGESDEADESTLELTNDDSGNVLDENTEDLDAMDEVDDETAEASALDVSYSSSVAGQARWTAFYAGVPVAMASKSSAGKNADIFDTPSFGHAALATAKVGGVKKALAELGFTGIKRKVSVSKAVTKMVDAQIAAARTALAADQTQFKERFMAALATAAVGLNRGFFAEKKNPVKSTLWNSMSSAGIRNPEVLIDTAFKNHADAYHKTLFEIADDIASKPVDVQDSLSKAISGMTYQEVSNSSADASLEGRLETFGTSVSSAKEANPQPTVAVQRQQITNAVKSLGRSRSR